MADALLDQRHDLTTVAQCTSQDSFDMLVQQGNVSATSAEYNGNAFPGPNNRKFILNADVQNTGKSAFGPGPAQITFTIQHGGQDCTITVNVVLKGKATTTTTAPSTSSNGWVWNPLPQSQWGTDPSGKPVTGCWANPGGATGTPPPDPDGSYAGGPGFECA